MEVARFWKFRAGFVLERSELRSVSYQEVILEDQGNHLKGLLLALLVFNPFLTRKRVATKSENSPKMNLPIVLKKAPLFWNIFFYAVISRLFFSPFNNSYCLERKPLESPLRRNLLKHHLFVKNSIWKRRSLHLFFFYFF